MRLFKSTFSANWKYIIGELLLIVVGVTLALMASASYESWQARQDERRSLEQISLALKDDLAFLQENFESLKQNEQNLLALLELLRHDELGQEAQPYFLSVTAWRGIELRTGPYDELKARGLSLISSDSLRLKLVNLYDSSFGWLQGVTEHDEVFSRDQIYPYVYEHFRGVGTGELEPANGYAAMDTDLYFENLVAMKLQRLQARLLPSYEETLALVREVLVDIHEEMGGAQTNARGSE